MAKTKKRLPKVGTIREVPGGPGRTLVLKRTNKSKRTKTGRMIKQRWTIIANKPSKPHKKLNVAQASKANKRRKKTSRMRDKQRDAKHQYTDERWRKHPDQYDYPGVDTRS